MYKNEYQKWLSTNTLDEKLKQELLQMSEHEMEEAFYKNLEFGTGGMRGVMGAGINRINKYTIRKANVGFGKYLLNRYNDDVKRGVVIAYDNRHKSREFALESAGVLGALGIPTYLFESLRPTPELSFAVRHIHAVGGIVITASHNPPKYNGYKIYDEDGCQLVPKYADDVIQFVNQVDDLFAIPSLTEKELKEKGLLKIIGKDIDDLYLKAVQTVLMQKSRTNDRLKIVFTPLHGTSAIIGLRALKENGFNVIEVKEQMVPDPDFSTVKSPNPENKEAFDMALTYGEKYNADLLIATDPDADRLGVAAYHQGEYIFLTGNQTGAILLHYLLSQHQKAGTLPKQGVVFKTVVTSDFGAKIARAYNMDVISTLTGFKFIGEQAKLLEGTTKQFFFGYEESYGYVIKDFVRDKDSIQALLLISEIAGEVKKEEKSLVDYLYELYDKFGYYQEDLVNIVLEGVEGEKKIQKILAEFRDNKPLQIASRSVITVEDYLVRVRYNKFQEEPIEFPKSNVLKFILDDGSWFVLRPSGTEPKLKLYFSVKGESMQDAKTRLQMLKQDVLNHVKAI
jgi:phosphoglucomutase